MFAVCFEVLFSCNLHNKVKLPGGSQLTNNLIVLKRDIFKKIG